MNAHLSNSLIQECFVFVCFFLEGLSFVLFFPDINTELNIPAFVQYVFTVSSEFDSRTERFQLQIA